MNKIDCKITENFLKEWNRMCDLYQSRRSACLMSSLHNEHEVACTDFAVSHPAEAIAIVQKWSNEHPVKTIKDDFLEKHPNAPKATTGTPLACAWRVGYLDEDGCLCGKCTECWNRPLMEVQK